MGSKINLFSNLPKKSFFGFYLRNNHIPTVLGRPFFTLCPVIFLQKRGLRTGTPTNHSKFAFFLTKVQNCAKCGSHPLPRGGQISSIFSPFHQSAPFGAQGCPRVAPGSPFSLILSWIFTHFVMDFHSFCHGKPENKSHTVQNQAEFRVKNFPGNPEKKTR